MDDLGDEPVRIKQLEPVDAGEDHLVLGDAIKPPTEMSQLRSALDANLLREIAYKRLNPKLAKQDELRARFIAEAQITAKLDYPGIVPIYDLGVDSEGVLFYTMKRIRGVTLTEKMASTPAPKRSRRQLRELIEILIKVCDALVYAHHRKVVHCDLKPDNIMIGDFGETYLLDWGIAKLLSDESFPFEPHRKRLFGGRKEHKLPETDERAWGTPSYMAPEQAQGKNADIDPRTDVFGVGAILFEIINGHPPYVGDTDNSVLLQAMWGIERETIVPASRIYLPLVDVVAKATATEQSNRYGSMSEVRRDLDAFLRSGWLFERRRLPRGTLVVEEGSAAHEVFVVTSGECRAFKRVMGEQQWVGSAMGYGTVFGESGMIEGVTRSASVVATTDLEICVLDREDLAKDDASGDWMAQVLRSVVGRFVDKDRRVTELELRIGVDRLILDHLSRRGTSAPDGRWMAPWRELRDRIIVNVPQASSDPDGWALGELANRLGESLRALGEGVLGFGPYRIHVARDEVWVDASA